MIALACAIVIAPREIATVAVAQTNTVLACDLAAANPLDTQKPADVHGIDFDRIDSTTAVTACSAATAADPQNSRLLYELGRALYAAKRDDEAVPYYEKAAGAGYVQAQANLGNMYVRGQGVAQDYAKAIKWYRLAANQGNASAQNGLAIMYDRGSGVAQDYAEAAKWYRFAAAQGSSNAQTTLGIMYQQGQGVAQDYAEAVKWNRKAADQGVAQAQYNLGVMFERGDGVPKDSVEAMRWYLKAADQGFAHAKERLNLMTQPRQAQSAPSAPLYPRTVICDPPPFGMASLATCH